LILRRFFEKGLVKREDSGLLFRPTSIPMAKGKYINWSLPRHQDIDAALKIVDEALAKAGKK
jgi:hypothetical protein